MNQHRHPQRTGQPMPASIPIGLLRAYGLVVSTGVEGVNDGWEMIERAVASIDADDDAVPAQNAWNGILLVITHSAALSRMLFPIGPRKVKGEPPAEFARRKEQRTLRGTELRAWLDVAEDSPLDKSGRDLRDTIEHWDERIEEWYADADDNRGTFRWAIGPAHTFDPNYHYVRTYDPTTKTVTIGRDPLDLGPLLIEVDRLWNAYHLVVADLSEPPPAVPRLDSDE